MSGRARLLFLIVTAIIVLGAVDGADAATPRTCDQLRGTTQLKTATIKVVKVRVRDKRLQGVRAFGCVLPRGKVFRVAEEGLPVSGPYEGANQINYRFGIKAGRFLEVITTQGDGLAQTGSEQRAVMDLGAGDRRQFYRGFFGEGGCGNDNASSAPGSPPVERVVLSATGVFAVHYADRFDQPAECFPHKGKALLRGYPRTGHSVQLDLAPMDDLRAASVAVSGTTVTWTTAGKQRRRNLGVTATQRDNGRAIELRRGETLRISLPENASTGFGWRFAEKPSRRVLRLRSNRYADSAEQQPSGQHPIAGAPGRRVITYRAGGRGTARLRLALVPPGGGRPDRTFRLRVDVR